MSTDDRIRRLEHLILGMMRHLKTLPSCEQCGLDARSIDEVDIISQTGRCGECHANETDIEDISEES